MWDDFISIICLGVVVGGVFFILSRSQKKQHRWYEVDSTTITHAARVSKRNKDK